MHSSLTSHSDFALENDDRQRQKKDFATRLVSESFSRLLGQNSFQHCINGFERVSFEPIVDVNKCLVAWPGGHAFGNQFFASRSRLGIWLLHLVIRAEFLLYFLIIAARFKQETCGAEIWVRPTAGERHLLADAGHGVLRIVNVRDSMTGETREIIGLQPVVVA